MKYVIKAEVIHPPTFDPFIRYAAYKRSIFGNPTGEIIHAAQTVGELQRLMNLEAEAEVWNAVRA